MKRVFQVEIVRDPEDGDLYATVVNPRTGETLTTVLADERWLAPDKESK